MNPTDPLLVVALSEPDGTRAGWFGPSSEYVETVWLPVVGPASFLTWRRLAGQLEHRSEGLTTSLAELSAAVGLGSPHGTQAAIARSLRRLQRFGLAWHPVENLLMVRRALPPVSAEQLSRLHLTVQRRHRQLCRPPLGAHSGDDAGVSDGEPPP